MLVIIFSTHNVRLSGLYAEKNTACIGLRFSPVVCLSVCLSVCLCATSRKVQVVFRLINLIVSDIILFSSAVHVQLPCFVSGVHKVCLCCLDLFSIMLGYIIHEHNFSTY